MSTRLVVQPAVGVLLAAADVARKLGDRLEHVRLDLGFVLGFLLACEALVGRLGGLDFARKAAGGERRLVELWRGGVSWASCV